MVLSRSIYKINESFERDGSEPIRLDGLDQANDRTAHGGSLDLHEGFDQRLSMCGGKKVGEVVRRWGVAVVPRRQTGHPRRSLKFVCCDMVPRCAQLIFSKPPFAQKLTTLLVDSLTVPKMSDLLASSTGRQMRAVVPGWNIPRRALEFGRELKALGASDFYEFDFQDVSFVTPGWLIGIGSALRRFREERPQAKCRATNYKHLEYAAHVGFFKYFGMTYGLAPSEAEGSNTYVPITEVKVATIKECAANGYIHAGEIVEEEARRLARLLTRQEDGALVDTLTYSIREIVRNVVEHSKSETYTISAQYWPTQQSAELAVADAGCGILSSLGENPKLQIDSDLDALKLAMLPGISSKAWRQGRSRDVWANSGYGLFMTQRLCSLGGQFTLVSGANGIRTTDTELQELETHSPGTTVILRLHTGAINNLSAQLSSFHAEGREIAKKVGGANQFGPSLASQVLQPKRRQ